MNQITLSSKKIRLILAAATLLSVASPGTVFRATASTPTCPGVGCTGGYLRCADLSFPGGTTVMCLTQS
jgi:hypothetical protein